MELIGQIIFIIGAILLCGCAGLTLAVLKIESDKRQQPIEEPNEEILLDEAVDVISNYCKGQKESERCAFNLAESNAICECSLLSNIPEERHGNHKDRP